MRYAFVPLSVVAAIAVTGCTFGAPSASGRAASGAISGATIVEVSLLKYPPIQTDDGPAAGYNDANITVGRGAIIQFHNQDTFSHTATFINNTNWPAQDPFTTAALTQSGKDLADAGWSTGELRAGAYSQGFVASRAAEYYYGCYYHYGTPMRGKITVR